MTSLTYQSNVTCADEMVVSRYNFGFKINDKLCFLSSLPFATPKRGITVRECNLHNLVKIKQHSKYYDATILKVVLGI